MIPCGFSSLDAKEEANILGQQYPAAVDAFIRSGGAFASGEIICEG